MIANQLRSHIVAILSLASLAMAGRFTRAQPPDPRLEKVLADWKKRQETSQSAYYRLNGEKIVARVWSADRGSRHWKEVAHDVRAPLERAFLSDWKNGRYRLELNDQEYDANTDKWYPSVMIRTFDGTHVKGFRPRDANTHPLSGIKPSEPEIGIGSGWLGGAAIEIIYWPPFFGHGVVPTRSTGLKAGNLKLLPDKELMVVHGQTVYRGRVCLVLRTRPIQAYQAFDEFWVDLEKDSAIIRHFLYGKERPECELDIEYQTTSGGWLPSRWTYTNRELETGTVINLERVQVRNVTLDLPLEDAAFDIEEKPGMKVQEYFYQPPNKNGVWPKPGTRLFLVGDDGVRHEISDHKGKWWQTWWWLALFVPVWGVIAWLIYRRSQRSRTVRL